MHYRLGLCLISLLLLGFLYGGMYSVQAASRNPAMVRHLVQMPLAVHNTERVGFPEWQVRDMAQALLKGRVQPDEFNAALRFAPSFARRVGSLKAPGNLFQSGVSQGLTGQAYVDSIQSEFDKFNVGPTDFTRSVPLPLDGSYYSTESLKKFYAMLRKNEKDEYGREEPPENPQPTDQPQNRRRPRRPGPPGPSPGPGPGGPRRGPGPGIPGMP